mmetsp:Transcript_22721/g.54391  ORF Transcript_22721/g.54391 Transcript_22721/m.54391 type:complete len:417 (+) Transcript_22721:194-1444(+)
MAGTLVNLQFQPLLFLKARTSSRELLLGKKLLSVGRPPRRNFYLAKALEDSVSGSGRTQTAPANKELDCEESTEETEKLSHPEPKAPSQSLAAETGRRRSPMRSLFAQLAVSVGAVGTVWLCHSTDVTMARLTAAAIGGVGLAQYGYRRRALSPSGAAAAALVGFLTMASSFRFTVVLLGFFLASSAITRVGEELKDIEEGHKKGGQRDAWQVLSNGGIPSALAVAFWAACGAADAPLAAAGSALPATVLPAAFLGYYACCCGDTWASELGVLSKATPRLITTLQPVRPGTNGAVTPLGTAASLAGGAFIGLCFGAAGLAAPGLSEAQRAAMQAQAAPCLMAGAAAGLLGSVVDSLLGATVQFTGYNRKTKKITSKRSKDVTHISGISVLDNNTVNLVSASFTSFCCTLLALVLAA